MSVQVINLDSWNFVGNIFNLNLFCWNLLVNVLGLLNQICWRFLYCLLLGSMVKNIISNCFGFGMELHNGLFKDGHFVFNLSLDLVHVFTFLFSLSQWVLEHFKIFSQLLLFSLKFGFALLKKFTFPLTLWKLLMKIFWNFLFFSSLITDSTNFTFNLENFIIFVFNQFFYNLKSLISLLHFK